MKSICFKWIFGYVPLLVTVLFLYLPGLFDLCSNLGGSDHADTGGKTFFSTWMHIRWKVIKAEYFLSYNMFSFTCLSIGIALMLLGIYSLKMNAPVAALSIPPAKVSESQSQGGR